MKRLGDDKWLGFDVLETYAYYDQPILFSAKDDKGEIYLVVLEDENDVRGRWLSVRLSPERYAKLSSGELDFHDAYKLAEDGHVNVLLEPFAVGQKGAGFPFPCDRLTVDMLPLPGCKADG